MKKYLQTILRAAVPLGIMFTSSYLRAQEASAPVSPSVVFRNWESPAGVWGGAGFVDFRVYAITHLPIGSVVIGKPITIFEKATTSSRNSDGTMNTTVNLIEKERDSKGRERIEVDDTDKGTPYVSYIVITDPIRQVYVVLDTKRHLAQIMHPPKASSISVDGSEKLGSTGHRQNLSTKSILGVAVDGVRTTATVNVPGANGKLADVQHIVDSWRSQDLDIELERRDIYSGVIEIDIETLKIERTEPDASLFIEPPGYAVTDTEGLSLKEKRP